MNFWTNYVHSGWLVNETNYSQDKFDHIKNPVKTIDNVRVCCNLCNGVIYRDEIPRHFTKFHKVIHRVLRYVSIILLLLVASTYKIWLFSMVCRVVEFLGDSVFNGGIQNSDSFA